MGASTIVIVRQDLSIPGSDPNDHRPRNLAEVETRFFDVLRASKPDVILLDATSSQGGEGVATIVKIRRRSTIPIVVVCAAADKWIRDYRLAGATECLSPPVDLVALNRLILKIINSHARVSGTSRAVAGQTITFSGITFIPHEDLLVGENGSCAKLTTSESRALNHFLANPWIICRRDEIARSLYGRHLPNSDRAVDVIVTRLRKKMASLVGASAQRLIKTEFRRGYILVSDTSVSNSTSDKRQPRRDARCG
jgi:two-component system OmpR family response regulator